MTKPQIRFRYFTVLVSLLLSPVASLAQDDGPSRQGPVVPPGQPIFLEPPEVVDAEMAAIRGGAGFLNDASACEAVLEHAATVYASEYSIDDKRSWAYHKMCGSSSNSSSTGLDLLVGKLSLGFSNNEAERKNWCDENERYSSSVQAYQRLENRVMATAIQNWSQCMDAFAENLIVRVSPSLDDNVFQFRVKNGTDTPRQLTNLGVISNEGSGLTCDQTIPPNVTIQPAQTHSFVCQRTYVEVRREGDAYQILPGGSISIANNLSPYLYSFRERFRNDVVPRPNITKLVFILDGQHIGTKQYWAGGARSTLQYCRGAIPNDQPREGFDLIDMGKREVRVGGLGTRGLCGTPPYCDSHNEFCNELYWVRGCYINKEWHEWYKAEVARVGIAYSEQAVCAPPVE